MINPIIQKQVEKLKQLHNVSVNGNRITIGVKPVEFEVGKVYNVILEPWMINGDKWCREYCDRYNHGARPMGARIKEMTVLELAVNNMKVEGLTWGDNLYERTMFKGWIPKKAVKEVLSESSDRI